MDLYRKMLNITGNSPELSVEMAISETKDALKYLNVLHEYYLYINKYILFSFY